jgi:hypothetical protein
MFYNQYIYIDVRISLTYKTQNMVRIHGHPARVGALHFRKNEKVLWLAAATMLATGGVAAGAQDSTGNFNT